MKEWYRQQINKMIMHINDELFLKRIYIIVRNHIKKVLIVFLLFFFNKFFCKIFCKITNYFL